MRLFGRRWIVAVTAIAASVAVAPAQADVKTGVTAWQAGNFDVAVKEWRPLADKGDADAQFNMGQAYKLGRGVTADMAAAQSWFEKAANQGHVQAQANLGLILFQAGQREAAMPWIRKAADRDDPRAQYVLATAMFNGDTVEKNWTLAYALMTRSAAQGLPQARTSLEQMDKYVPLEDREKGAALAKQMASKPISTASAAPTKSTPAPARQAPATKPPVPAAKPTPPPKSAESVKVASAGPPPSAARPAASLASTGGRWRVQLGAFGSPALARSQWSMLSKKIGALSGLQPSYEPVGALTRLRVGPLADRSAADRVCAAAKSAGQACFPVAP
jgi:cell division septation protein DedD